MGLRHMTVNVNLMATAETTLKSLKEISEKAHQTLSNARLNPASALGQINTFNDGQSVSNGAQISQNLTEEYSRLVREPALARISVIDENLSRKVYYFARSSTVSGISNFASYKAPIGRLASQDIGDFYILPNGTEVEVVEKLILNPVETDGTWDSKHTTAFFKNVPASVIASLRAVLSNTAVEDQDEDPFAEWDLTHTDASADHSREVLNGSSLRDQAILDKAQDEIFRMPLQARLMLKGPPGTGKTTTLIRRLGQKLQLPEEMTEDLNVLTRSRPFNELQHKDSWLMFTPTQLLEHYLREAFGKEGVPADNSKIVTWEAFREPIAKDQFKLLRGGNGGGGFVLKPREIHGTHKAHKHLISWFEDFDKAQSKQYFVELCEAADTISKCEQENLQVLGNRASQLLNQNKTLSLALIDLQQVSENLQKWISKRRLAIRTKLDRHLRGQINRDRSFALQFLRQIESLQNEKVDDTSEEDLLSDESVAQPTSRGEQIAFQTFRRAMQAFAKSIAQKRNLPKGSQNARLLEWLGERAISHEDAFTIGSELLLMSDVSLLAAPVSKYFREFTRRYRDFRLKNLNGWYNLKEIETSSISPHELDVLFLAYLKNANRLMSRQAVTRDIDNRYWASVKEVGQLYRNQIVVDEVTDFSPLQLAAMYELAHPDIRSFFACGDFNQRLTHFGISSEEQLRWAIPEIMSRPVNVGYRQSQRLAEFTHDLLLAISNEKEVVHPPKFGSHKGVQPVLLEGEVDLEKNAVWLSDRILEIETAIGTLPSCAIFVPSELDIQPLTSYLSKLLETANIKARACPNGEVLGRSEEVRIFSIEHIKGLEFESAFFVGLEFVADGEDPLVDKHLYVGATRAATYLGLACKQKLPSRFDGLRKRSISNWKK